MTGREREHPSVPTGRRTTRPPVDPPGVGRQDRHRRPVLAAPGLTILVLAKSPRPGRSKTRLAPRFGFEGAAALAAAALADTLEAVAAAPAETRVLVLDGESVPPLPPGFQVIPQVSGTHGERIAAALAAVPGPALLIGMDTPQVTPRLLTVDRRGSGPQAWLGLAEDGGWWALGLRDPGRYAHRVLAGVPMSTPRTGAAQYRALLAAGLTVAQLPVLRDVDEPEDALAVAALAPDTHFADLARRLQRDQLPGARTHGRRNPAGHLAAGGPR